MKVISAILAAVVACSQSTEPLLVAEPIIVPPPWSYTVHQWAQRWSIVSDSVTRIVPDSIADIILQAADRHEVDRELAFALVYVESRFRPRALSVAYARGLSQVMLRTGRYMKPNLTREELYEPRLNVDLGFRHLAFLLDRYDGNRYRALVAYNAGERIANRLPEQHDSHPYPTLIKEALAR